MNPLKQTFRRHGLRYSLIKRNEQLCIYGVSGTYTDKILHYEVMKIRIRNNEFGHREAIPSDANFGMTKDTDQHFQSMAEAEQYYTAWEAKLSITGKEKPKSNSQVSLTPAEVVLMDDFIDIDEFFRDEAYLIADD